MEQSSSYCEIITETPQQSLAQSQVIQDSHELFQQEKINENATWESENLVFDRDEYARKDFWDDRFKETHGFFDWYANWDQMKSKYTEQFPDKYDQILMVGCGNSKLSEEMFKDGYQCITNMDISQVVLQKMKDHYDKQALKQKEQTGAIKKQSAQFEYLVMDATQMNFKDNSFDICIDKGTYDALACGGPSSKETLRGLVSEMVRVCRKGTIIVSSGTPEKRLPYLNEFVNGIKQSDELLDLEGSSDQVGKDGQQPRYKIEHQQLELSHLANLINILRTELKDKPLSHALKNGELLKKAIQQTIEAQEKKRAEEESKDPRKRLLRLMLKAKAKRDREMLEKAGFAVPQEQEEKPEFSIPKSTQGQNLEVRKQSPQILDEVVSGYEEVRERAISGNLTANLGTFGTSGSRSGATLHPHPQIDIEEAKGSGSDVSRQNSGLEQVEVFTVKSSATTATSSSLGAEEIAPLSTFASSTAKIKEDQNSSRKKYDPKRQDFVMMYVIAPIHAD